jgi:hypothetical protein
MSLTKSPVSNFGSGTTRVRTAMITAAAALIGTVVGGVSVLGIVLAVTQPPNHEIRSDARAVDGAATASPGSASLQQTQAEPTVESPSSAGSPSGQNMQTVTSSTSPGQAAAPPPPSQVVPRQVVPPVQGPRTVWPDALSARTASHDSEPTAEKAAPQQVANDQQAASNQSASNQNNEPSAAREPSAVGKSAVLPRESLRNQIPPNPAPAKRRIVGPPPSGQSIQQTMDEAPAGNESVGKARIDTRRSQSQQARQQRSPDTAERSGDDQATVVSPPRRRVIVLPGPDQAANDDRGHWGGGLFDFFGQSHSYGDHWNQDHWNNDWHGSYDGHN